MEDAVIASDKHIRSGFKYYKNNIVFYNCNTYFKDIKRQKNEKFVPQRVKNI